MFILINVPVLTYASSLFFRNWIYIDTQNLQYFTPMIDTAWSSMKSLKSCPPRDRNKRTNKQKKKQFSVTLLHAQQAQSPYSKPVHVSVKFPNAEMFTSLLQKLLPPISLPLWTPYLLPIPTHTPIFSKLSITSSHILALQASLPKCCMKNKLPHLDVHCLASSFWILNMIYCLDKTLF